MVEGYEVLVDSEVKSDNLIRMMGYDRAVTMFSPLDGHILEVVCAKITKLGKNNR